MSTLKADAVTTKSDNTDLTLTGGGTGVPNLEAGFKVGGSAGVPTASVQDDAITLAKLAAGTDGELITWDASGDPAAVAVGTATHILTSNGVGAAPTFQAAAGGGAWTLIGTSVASDSATLTITGLDSTYDTYAIAISDMVPATDESVFYIRVGDSGGIDASSGDYQFHCGSVAPDSASYGATTAQNQNSIQFSNQGVGSAAGEGIGALFYLTRPADGTTTPLFTGTYTQVNGSGLLYGGEITASRKAVITLDRIQCLQNTGNLTSGRMTIWGIAHA